MEEGKSERERRKFLRKWNSFWNLLLTPEVNPFLAYQHATCCLETNDLNMVSTRLFLHFLRVRCCSDKLNSWPTYWLWKSSKKNYFPYFLSSVEIIPKKTRKMILQIYSMFHSLCVYKQHKSFIRDTLIND